MRLAKRMGLSLAMVLLGTLLIGAPLSAAVGAQAGKVPETAVLAEQSKALAAVIHRVLPAVVHINVVKTVQAESQVPDIFNDPFFQRFFGQQMPQTQPEPRKFEQKGLGTGFIVSPDGYILTNNHVAGDADKITVKLRDGREFQAKLVGADPATDLAVVKIPAKDLPTLQFGDSRQLEVGETVIAIGNPFGLEQTVTEGIVSAKGRSQLGLSEYEDYIQTDASINPGNSGGPLIDVTGKVMGVNSAIFSQSGGNMGIGFAIPSDLARHIMTSLIKNGAVHRGFLGVSIQDVTPELADAMGLKVNQGVLVSEVEADSPAAKAGLHQGDVIVALDGQAVNTANDLRVRVADQDPGSTMPLTVIRNGAHMTVRVTLSERPAKLEHAQQGQSGRHEAPAGEPERRLGLSVQPLTSDLAEQLGYQGRHGVLVASVESGSAAEDAGLQRGALILEVNRHPVPSLQALRHQLREAKPGEKLLLLVRMGDATQFLALAVPK
jgi:Do/DeqQ family serine protease